MNVDFINFAHKKSIASTPCITRFYIQLLGFEMLILHLIMSSAVLRLDIDYENKPCASIKYFRIGLNLLSESIGGCGKSAKQHRMNNASS